MQSTGHSSTQARSFTSMHGSVITYVIPAPPRIERFSMGVPPQTRGRSPAGRLTDGRPRVRGHCAEEEAMAGQHEQRLRDLTDALNAGDMDTFLGGHTEDVVFHVAGAMPFSGDHEGREAMGAAFGT